MESGVWCVWGKEGGRGAWGCTAELVEGPPTRGREGKFLFSRGAACVFVRVSVCTFKMEEFQQFFGSFTAPKSVTQLLYSSFVTLFVLITSHLMSGFLFRRNLVIGEFVRRHTHTHPTIAHEDHDEVEQIGEGWFWLGINFMASSGKHLRTRVKNVNFQLLKFRNLNFFIPVSRYIE